MQIHPDVLFGAVMGLISAALYAGSVVVYRSQAEEMSAIQVSATKMWTALPLMAFLVIIGLAPDLPTLTQPIMLILALSIVLGAVIGDTVYLVSQERIGVSYAFPIAMSFPITTYFLTVIFLGEPLLFSRLLGVVITVLGVIVISREQEFSEDETKPRLDLFGILLAVITSLLYAVGTTILQVGVADVDPISANFVRVLAGSIAFVPLVGYGLHNDSKRPSKRNVKIVIIAAFFGMAIGSILFVTAVKFAGAAVMAVMSSTAPLFAVPFSVFYLKERLTRLAGLGIIATVVGIVLVVMAF
ncbi:MAG: conserved membrane protein of unknown function [Candidatus Thorarchaeota archaeon]|nr:MAG: conserved membrane protein of unknown function [Candidatus Thorarchaeota archaeon]